MVFHKTRIDNYIKNDMKTNLFIRHLALVLVALLAGSSPTWAWDHQDTFTDDGNEQCMFRYSGANMTYSGKSLGASDIRGFRTKVKFDNLNGIYYWEFHQRVCFKTICDKSNSDRLNTSIKGTMYVITDDEVPHKLCDYSKAKGSDKIVISNQNLDYGTVIVSDETSYGWLELKMLPTDLLLKEGFKRVRFSNDRLIYSTNQSWGPFEYEKETGTNYTPMPNPTFSWDADGKVRATALGVPNGSNFSDCKSQAYSIDIFRYDIDNTIFPRSIGSVFMMVNDETISSTDGNRADLTKSFSINNEYAYILPLWFHVEPMINVHPIPELLNEVWYQEKEKFLLAPYTHPDELTMSYDQWNQTVSLQWTYVKGFDYLDDNNSTKTLNCRTEGKWYLLRREKSKDNYQLITSFDNTQKRFSYTDADCALDKEYVYRVVFVPNVLVATYGNNPQDMPFSGLWSEKTISTVPEVPIRLKQDRADEGGVALYWEHSIQDPDAKFSVQRTSPGGSSWTTIARDIAVNVSQPYATYVDENVSSPCEFYSYRVTAQTLGHEFTSNVIEGNLPAGSRITAVDASKGTEASNVIVKWRVQQRGTEDTWFSIRRRILGTRDNWTEIGSTHGTATEYTFIDDRVMAGSYYEYAVIAYSKECDEQPTQSDMVTASGFSQARGTITGHVSFGTGTAVRDVRVNLVKTTEGNEEDMQQYLSRYIEGEGKGLYWAGDSVLYAPVFNSSQPLTLQLWAQPANGGSKMELARINNAIELGVRRADDTTPFTYRYTQWGKVMVLEKGQMNNRKSSPGLNGSSEGGASLYDCDPNTKMCAMMEGGEVYSTMKTDKPYYVSSYVFTAANDAAQYPERNPRSWRIEASKLASNWETVATVTDDTRMIDAKNNETFEYPLDVPGTYQYFRIHVTSTQGSEIFQLADMTYKSVVDEEVEETISDVTVVSDGQSQDDAETNLYHLYAIDLSKPDYAVTEFPSLTFSDRDFTHVAALYTDNKWTFQVGTDTLHMGSMTTTKSWNAFDAPSTLSAPLNSPTLSFGGNSRLLGSAYKGYVDDVRLWSRKLTDKEIAGNYTRMLGGTESGLQLYWPLDEGLQVKEYAFDVACQEGIYTLNHPTVGINATPSTHVPEKLKLYGLTDGQGDYIIRGIPFQQGGTNYKVMPSLGIHEFNPNSRSMFVSPTSLTANNVDFEDVSAFPMSGYVYYAGTNIPAEGIELYVDGEVVMSNGAIQKTDASGYYQISVPIGKHYVEAKLEGHKMVGGGRFPLEDTFDFDRRMQYDFADSTLVNFVGRISGGERNDTLPVGFGASRNNIGMAMVTLKLNNESLSFNCGANHISDTATTRTWDSDTTSIASRAWTGTGYDGKYVFIQTDSLTGEFSALLPPLKYVTKSIRIIHTDSNRDIEFADLPQIDLTTLNRELKDSLEQEMSDGSRVMKYYTYNTKMVRSYYAEPKLEVWQTLINGLADAPRGVFGLKNVKDYTDDFGTVDSIAIWTREADGAIKYQFGLPVYRTYDNVRLGIRGYEAYTNYDSGQAVSDTIPLSGQRLTIANEMSEDQLVVAKLNTEEELGLQPGDVYNLKSDELVLDSRGRNELLWKAGLPNIVSPYARQLTISFERNDRTYVWNDLHAIVLGSLETGSNFVSLGPDVITMVLRDPPGATSKTTWKTGKTKTKLRTETQGFYGNEKFTADVSTGIYTETELGVGVAALTSKAKITSDYALGFVYKVDRNNQTERTWTTTTTKAVSTGSGKDFVGARGDVYIGASTNLIIGETRKLGFFREGPDYPFKIDLRNGRSIGDSIRTTFMYSAYELEEVMIPKWEDTRRGLMTFVGSKEEAQHFENTSDHCVYATWLPEDDPLVGESDTTYYQIPPSGWDGTFRDDSVKWCSNQIAKWEQLMADNEEDKVLAMQGNSFKENISFDGGTSYSYSSRCDTTYQKKHNYSHNLGGIVKFGGTSEAVIGGAMFSIKAMWDTENGWTMATTESDPDENHKEWAEFEYAFSDGNKGTDFSVNRYSSPGGWSDIFSLIGGQSYNPYEGEERTKYFEKDQHVLSNGTVRMEQPDIQISLDGEFGGKSATLTDVPSGQTGQFVLHLSNNGTTHQGFDFVFDLLVQEKADTLGLEVMMDGVPASGRTVFIPAGETVKKIITVRQTDQSILDYEGIEILMLSQYQPMKIHDMVKLNVHFMPSSSPIDLVIGEPVLNIETLARNEGNLELKVSNFNRQFKGMTKLGVEYRYEGSTTWTQPSELTFLVDPEEGTGPDAQLLPETGVLRLSFDMSDDNFFPQGTYTFRAYTTTMYDSDAVHVYSQEIAVVKDNVRPRNLTTPTPPNGILRYGDDISIEFNEDIVPGYVGDKNIIVTAKLNHQPINHDVALQLIPYGVAAHTTNPVFLNGDFSFEFWVKWTEGGYLLRQGKSITLMSMSIDNAGHVKVSIGGSSYISENVLPKDTWTYIVLSYKSSDMTFSALGQYGTVSVMLFDEQPVTFSAVESINYSDDNLLYLGSGITAAIHDLALYNIYRDVNEAGATKYVTKDQYVYGLINYWPMNEGHGSVAADSRHTHDFEVYDRWELSNKNYSYGTDSSSGVTADISRINTSAGDSYAIELWANTYSGAGTLFETGSNASNKLCLRYDDEMNTVLDYGEKSQVVASHADFPQHDSWHHLALNVVRGQAASFYYNGQRTAVIAEVDMPSLEGSQIRVGANHNGRIDELRIWHATLTEDKLLANMYNCIDTTDVYSRGLVAYYPFEKQETVNGVLTYVGTLEDLAPANTVAGHALTGDESALSSYGPPLKKAPEESRLIAKPVASERKVVIRLEEGAGIKARDVEGTTLNITVDKVHDTHGNESNPIRWTTFVQLNTLKWTKDSVNVNKKYGADYTFDVNIENRGGSTEYYTLYNMPQWLTLVDSERTDDIGPLSTKTLRFKVNPLMAVGNYDLTIGLQGNNEILEPLRIVMKVRGEMPDWSVDPSKYENNMSIVGQIYLGGILMSNSESRLAAFIDGQCRGIAEPEQIRGAAFVPLSVYGTAQQEVNGVPVDQDKGKPITFRIWDATSGVAYTNVSLTLPDGTVVDTLYFDPTTAYGTFDSPVIFAKSNYVEQSLNLSTGWNWLSLGVEPADGQPSVVFKNLTSWNVRIKDRSTGTAYCNGTNWAGNLPAIHGNTMYKMLLNRLSKSKDYPMPFPISGIQLNLAECPIELGNGWNWIAYLPTTTMTLDEALAGANPKHGDQVKSQTQFAYYGPYGWEGNLKALESGKGYLYCSVDTITKQFVYPATTHSTLHAPLTSHLSSTTSNGVFTPVDPTSYPDNMSMVIQLMEGGEAVTTAEVAAFVAGECRGSAFATDGLYYLLITGEGSGQPMEIRACINDGSILTVCDALTFSSDANIGTPWEPFLIEVGQPTGITQYPAHPTPEVWYTLQGMRIGTERPVAAGVYICNGRKVVIHRTPAPVE